VNSIELVKEEMVKLREQLGKFEDKLNTVVVEFNRKELSEPESLKISEF